MAHARMPGPPRRRWWRFSQADGNARLLGMAVALGLLLLLVGQCAASSSGPDAAGPPADPLLPARPSTPPPTPLVPVPAPTASPTPTATPTSKPSPSARPEPSTPKPPEVTVTAPSEGQVIKEDRDFTVEGTAAGTGDTDLRIFVFVPDRQKFFLADYGPAHIGTGRWSVRSAGLGREFGGDDDTYVLLAVLADPSCRRSLAGLDLGNDNYPSFDRLPGGCVTRGAVRVIEGDP